MYPVAAPHTANQKISAMKADASALARVQRVAREATDVMGRAAAWAVANMDVMDWLEANMSSEFGASLADHLNRKGFLTDNQVAAVRRQLAEREAGAGAAIDVGRIEVAFNAARASGLKRLRLHLDTFRFKPAKEGGRNTGGIYVSEGETYLGKVLGGKFLRTRECSDEQEGRIIAAASDPEAAAHAFGQRTGTCAVCGLELTLEESIQRSMGAICASRYGL